MSKIIGNALSRQILDIASEVTWVESNRCYGRVLLDASLVSHASLEFGLLKILDMKAAEVRAQIALCEPHSAINIALRPSRGKWVTHRVIARRCLDDAKKH